MTVVESYIERSADQLASIENIIEAPLNALQHTQFNLAKTDIDKLKEFFFDNSNDESQVFTPKMFQFRYLISKTEEEEQWKIIRVPILTLAHYPSLAIDEINLKLSLTLGKYNVDTDGNLNFKASVAAEENTTSNKFSLAIKAKRIENPMGIIQIKEKLEKSISLS